MSRPKGARDADYELKRARLLKKLGERLMRVDETRPSLRQLAVAAGVGVPTLNYYFGGREQIVLAVIEEYRRLGEPYMQAATKAPEGLAESVHGFLTLFAGLCMTAAVGDVVAMALVEGLLNSRLGPACAANVLDPSVDALMTRLKFHSDRGEMAGDLNLTNAALMLLSPIIVGSIHQKHLGGAAARPLDMPGLISSLTEAFVAAYGAPRQTPPPAPPHPPEPEAAP